MHSSIAAAEIPESRGVDELANRLYEGDCLEVLLRLPANSVDLVLCDLPYGTTRRPASRSRFLTAQTVGR